MSKTPQDSESELPCPFCGCTNLNLWANDRIVCQRCHAEGPGGDGDAGAAVENWNTRASLPQSREAGEVNQCDGCARGLSMRSGPSGRAIHYGDSPSDLIACTADRYAAHPKADSTEAKGEAVSRLQQECDTITEMNHAQWLALENIRLLAARHRKERWAQHMLSFCEAAAGQSGSTLRDKAQPMTDSTEARDEDEQYTIERAADLLEGYADWIKRNVMSAEIEQHPYLPEIEGTAEDLRTLANAQPMNWEGLYQRMRNVAAGYSNHCEESGSTRRLEKEFTQIEADALITSPTKERKE